jgi:nucleoprotein TPR
MPAVDVSGAMTGVAGDQKTIDELREVVRFLRRDKEVLEFELESQQQECRRLQQQLEFTSRNLDETRALLTDERFRLANGRVLSEAEYAAMMEKSNQADLLRESNITLRDENNRNRDRAAGLEASLNALTAELDPMRGTLACMPD